MAWTEVVAERGRIYKTFRDSENPRRKVRHFHAGTTLHYEGSLDSGRYRTPVDMTPQAVDNSQLNGWIVNVNGWHYALGQPSGKADGWIGFIEEYIGLYGEFPPIKGVGLHYGHPVNDARDAHYYLLQQYGVDLEIAYSEFQVCGGRSATLNILQGLYDQPYVMGIFYYTNALPDPPPSHVSATCTLYDRTEDGQLIMNERGKAVRDFYKGLRGQ